MADGRVLHRGAGLAGCQVLLVRDGAVVADTEADAAGAWTLPDDGLVVARCRGDVLGLVAAPARDGLDLEVGPTHPLTVRIEAEGLPDAALVELTPLRVEGADPRWVTLPVRGMSARALAQGRAQDGSVAREVQPGEWWLAAGLELVADARTPGTEDQRWHAAGARVDGGAALQPLHGGYRLTVDGPLTVVVTLRRA